MSRKQIGTPAYRLHKPSGRAVVTLGRKDFYLGPHGSDESRREYDRVVAEWLANGRRTPGEPILIKGLVRRYLEFVEDRYASNEPVTIEAALMVLFELYGDRSVESFGPIALEAVRAAIIAQGHVRTQVNKRIGCVVRCFKWGVSRQIVPAEVWRALTALEGIRKGTPGVAEGRKVRPVEDAHVEAVLPHLSRHVAAMVRFQRLTGARSGEVCQLRPRDLATAAPVWEYRPERHKTAHVDHDRVIFVGPAAQAVLRPFLGGDPDAPVFRPADAEAERYAAARAARKSKVQPSQVDRSDSSSPRRYRDAYPPDVYRVAIARAIAKVNEARERADLPPIPHWHPHQLRHSAATQLRREFDAETARAVLGHSSLDATEIYAEADLERARDAMEKLG